MSAQLQLLPFSPTLARPSRVALTDPEAEAQAEMRKQIIVPLIDYRADDPRYGMLRLKDSTPVTSFSRMVEYVAETSGISSSTLYNWLRAYKNGGRPALADKIRSDKNTSRFFEQYPKAKWLAAYLHCGDPEFRQSDESRFAGQSVRACHEAILRNLDTLEIPPEDAPSYETVRAWLKQLPAALEIYARKGKKAYEDRMSPFLRRKYVDVFANELWVGDHAIDDIYAANDVFDDQEPFSRIRMRLTDLIDYRSRAVMGVSWAVEGSSNSLAAAGRRGFVQHGIPRAWYLDNGKDMQKIGKGAAAGIDGSPISAAERFRHELREIVATGFLARVGISVIYCIPFHPQSKHVERFHRTFHERFDKAWPTYSGGDPFSRPDISTIAIAQHSKLMRAGRGAESRLPLASRVISAALGWFEEYNNTPHSGEGNDGGTPIEVFNAFRDPNQRPTPDPAALALLMKDREVRMVRNCAITLGKRRYIPCDEFGWTVLHNYETCKEDGRDILIAFDRGLPESVDALDMDGNFLMTLKAEELIRFAPQDPVVQAQISESFRIRRGLERSTREAVSTIARIARTNGAQSPLEAMATRLQLAAGESGVDILTQRKPRLRPDKNAVAPASAADLAASFLESLK